MTITFDKKLGLERFKNENCLKWDNEFAGQQPKAVDPPKNSKIPSFRVFLFFYYFSHIFLDFGLLFHISILVRRF